MIETVLLYSFLLSTVLVTLAITAFALRIYAGTLGAPHTGPDLVVHGGFVFLAVGLWLASSGIALPESIDREVVAWLALIARGAGLVIAVTLNIHEVRRIRAAKVHQS